MFNYSETTQFNFNLDASKIESKFPKKLCLTIYSNKGGFSMNFIANRDIKFHVFISLVKLLILLF